MPQLHTRRTATFSGSAPPAVTTATPRWSIIAPHPTPVDSLLLCAIPCTTRPVAISLAKSNFNFDPRPHATADHARHVLRRRIPHDLPLLFPLRKSRRLGLHQRQLR